MVEAGAQAAGFVGKARVFGRGDGSRKALLDLAQETRAAFLEELVVDFFAALFETLMDRFASHQDNDAMACIRGP